MDFALFREKVKVNFHLDLYGYKEHQLQRRLNSVMGRNGIKDYLGYFNLLTSDKKAYQEFLDHLTINVTEFFRDLNIFKTLEKQVLPMLLGKKAFLKIWSAACSNGAEPYSIAIILDELAPRQMYLLEATDVDRNILKEAISGRYSAEAVRNVDKKRLSKYFYQEGSYYILHEWIKKRVSFNFHNLHASNYDCGYSLIVCRNVVIYFNKDAQDQIYMNFSKALAPGGVLFVGGSEMILNYMEYGFEKIAPCFYRKRIKD